MINHYRFFHITFILLLLSISGCLPLDTGHHPPTARKGVLDCRAWSSTDGDMLVLQGEWAFFWKKLLNPGEFEASISPTPDQYVKLPAVWNDYSVNGQKIGPYGFATYSLTLLHNCAGKPLAFLLKDMSTAYSLYVDGKLLCSNGKVGNSKSRMIPEQRPLQVHYTPETNRTRILLHISNYYYKDGGPFKAITIGNARKIEKKSQAKQAIDLFLIAAIFTMGVYQLSFFLINRMYKSPMFLGLFCCIIAFRTAVTNERILLSFFQDISWAAMIRIEYLSFYIGLPVFIMYMASIFSKNFSKKFYWISIVFALICALVVVLTEPAFFSHTLLAFQIFTILVGLYTVYLMLNLIRSRRNGSLVFAFGFLVLFVTAILDILGANYIIQTDFMLHIGQFVFVMTQAYLLSRLFTRTVRRVETQKNQLIESSRQFQNSRIALILGLAKLAEYRDHDTGSHLERIREYTKSLAEELAGKEKYSRYITREYIDDIYQSSILHDIGKVGIPDAILLKPGKLTAQEFEIIKTHTTIGGDALSAIESNSKVRSFLTLGRDIAYYHHEKWDGSGYPRGLKGMDIPLSARITAVADVYDALTSERPYKKAFTHEKAVQIILDDSGTHFDPEIVDTFKQLTTKFERIRRNFFD